MIEPSVVEERIRSALEGVSHVELRDLTGTKDHYEATIVATAFAGKTRIAQHQAVYRALGELMDGPVHALSLKTFTPEAWAARQG